MTKPSKIQTAFFVSGEVALSLPKLRDKLGMATMKITEEEKAAIEAHALSDKKLENKKKKVKND
jgi:hypothetical protein